MAFINAASFRPLALNPGVAPALALPSKTAPADAPTPAAAPTAPPPPRAEPGAIGRAGAAPVLTARAANMASVINAAALVALRDVEANGKKGTPPPMMARALYYVSAAVAEAYRGHTGPTAERVARSAAAEVLHGLTGQRVMSAPCNAVGQSIARDVLARANADGAARAGEPRTPASDSRPEWMPTDAAGGVVKPLLPSFGSVRHVVAENASVRARVPTFSDDDWRQLLAIKPTPAQETCARFWADGPDSFTPPGHWNAIATDCAGLARLSPAETAEMLHVLNAALLDAGISCWDTKFTHNEERPFQAAKRLGIEFNPLLPTPPFPGFTSGHATFSGAAAAVLGAFFDRKEGAVAALRTRLMAEAQLPAMKDAVARASTATEMFAILAREAADSRVFGGIHIAADGSEGLATGTKIGANVVAAMLDGAGSSSKHASRLA
jgi:hypothetical protein